MNEEKSTCPACGAAFTCGVAAGLSTCWCAQLPPAAALPTAPGAACYCPACLKKRLEAAAPTPPA